MRTDRTTGRVADQPPHPTSEAAYRSIPPGAERACNPPLADRPSFRCGNTQRMQRGPNGDNGVGDKDAEQWDNHAHRHRPDRGPDDGPSATIATGLSRRQFSLHKGRSPAYKTDGGWTRPAGGDYSEDDHLRRERLDALMQAADVPQSVQKRVQACVNREDTGRAWSRKGGWPSALCGVLYALGYDAFAEDVHDSEDLDTPLEDLAEHAQRRGLVDE